MRLKYGFSPVSTCCACAVVHATQAAGNILYSTVATAFGAKRKNWPLWRGAALARLRSRRATGIVLGRRNLDIRPFMSPGSFTANLIETGPQNRVLVTCVIASILAHSAVLLLFPGMRQGPPPVSAVTVLTATLARPSTPPPALAEAPRPQEPERPRPQVKPPPEPPRPLLTQSESAPSAPAPRVVEPPPVQTAMVPPSIPQAPVSARAPEVQAAPAPAVAPVVPSQLAPRPAESIDSGNVDQYRLALLGAANRYKRYPAIAMEKGWSGRVEIRIVIGASGMTQSISVKTSSGFEILDRTAVDMVTKAKPMTPIPPSLKGREFAVDVPVIFSLQTG